MYKGYDFKSGISEFVQKLNAIGIGRAKIRTVYTGTGASTDLNGIIRLPAIADDSNVSKATLLTYCGYVLHEWAHELYTDRNARVYLPNNSVPSNYCYAFQLWNGLEDGWIEGRVIDSGKVANAQDLFTRLVNKIYAEALAANIDWNDPAQWPFTLAVWSRRYLNIRPPVASGIAAIFDEALDRQAAINTSEGNASVAGWVYQQLEQYLATNPQPQPQPQPQPDDSGDDSGDDSQDGESGETSDESGDSAGDSGGESGDESGDDSADGSGDGDSDGDSAGDSGGESGEGDDAAGDSGGGQSDKGRPVDLNDIDPTAVEPTPDGRIESHSQRVHREEQVLDTSRRRFEPSVSDIEVDPVYDLGRTNEIYPAIQTPARLRYELARLFDNTSTEQYVAGQRAGQVNTGSLHRYSYDDAVFRRRYESEGVDTALSILIDVSTSTTYTENRQVVNGETIDLWQAEFAAARAIIESLQSSGVVFDVHTFSDSIQKVCDFGDGVAAFKRNINNARVGGGTLDYHALLYVHNRLYKRPEQRKIVLVLTDGDGWPVQAAAQCKVAERLGITTVGIGIGHDVSHVYSQAVRVNDLSELASVSLKQIKLAA